MNLYLGNMKLSEIVKEEYLEKVQKFLDENGYSNESVCDKVADEIGNYHIYDIPRHIHICGEEKTQQFINFLKQENLVIDGFICRVGIAQITPNQQ